MLRQLLVLASCSLLPLASAFLGGASAAPPLAALGARRAAMNRPSGVVSLRAAGSDCATTVVGGGRIGLTLQQFGKDAGFDDTLVKRGEKVPSDGSGPIYVCTRNDALKGVIAECPPERREDLVFYGQNGFIEDFLRAEGVFDSSTKVLVYMAVAKLGEKPTDGITSVNPEGLTAATGKGGPMGGAAREGHAIGGHARGLTRFGVEDATFQASMYEKLMWITSFMLLGVHHGGITVGEVEEKHRDDLAKMVIEMAACVTEEKGVAFKAGMAERLCAYAKTVGHFPTALKEFEWRNQYWLDTTRAREAAGKQDLTPFHTELLLKARDNAHVSFP
ncbi:hypothetical protein T484DRAFT_1654689 [Baffinella frigidus]|nr:hypothetical protein T484DRAFT_1654689 [Cryptophyta sp. CCMP2293]